MRIDRMILNFPDMRNTIVDSEPHLKNFNLDLLVAISVTVNMKPDEFAAFREWKVQYDPPRPVVEEKPKAVKASEYDEYAY